jgi:DNA-directed RNA polymerase subunit RPC12/RpoP
MKTNKFYLLLATFMVCATSVFISCSSDDDDNNNSKEQGDKAVKELQSRLLDEDGNVVFGEPNDQGVYEVGIETQTDAQKLVSQYAKDYSGAANYTYTLPDARGTVRVNQGDEEGVHYNLEVRVKGIPEMNLQVVEPNYMEGENKIIPFTSYDCNNCSIPFKVPNMAAKKCPSCGSSNVRKKTK